jgi:hypothetical protein
MAGENRMLFADAKHFFDPATFKPTLFALFAERQHF